MRVILWRTDHTAGSRIALRDEIFKARSSAGLEKAIERAATEIAIEAKEQPEPSHVDYTISIMKG